MPIPVSNLRLNGQPLRIWEYMNHVRIYSAHLFIKPDSLGEYFFTNVSSGSGNCMTWNV